MKKKYKIVLSSVVIELTHEEEANLEDDWSAYAEEILEEVAQELADWHIEEVIAVKEVL